MIAVTGFRRLHRGGSTAASAALAGSMSIQKLKWLFLAIALVFLLVVEWVRWQVGGQLSTWPGRLLMDAVILVGILFFFGAAFEVISQMQARLERQNREIEGLHTAAMDICSELSLDVVLQKVVDQACTLLDARYGAISIVDENHRIREFLTSGISAERREKIGAPPEGRGLLGVVMEKGQHLRLRDLSKDPRSAGFPESHPPMKSLLAVPIVCKSPFRGNLYLAEKKTAPEFSQEDEETLVRFATKVTIAIDNAHLHEQTRVLAMAEERLRIAREMHDGLAQVLAYVNTKAQVVKEYLRQNKTESAAGQLEQLAAAAREVYTDTREGIAALRTKVGPDRSLPQAVEDFVSRWQDQSGIQGELRADGELRLTPIAELQLLRIIQESLSNVRKHSGASTARVDLRQGNEHIEVLVEDDGRGFDLASRSRGGLPRFGLAIMRERAESIAASFEIDSAPQQGTRVRVRVPVRNEPTLKPTDSVKEADA